MPESVPFRKRLEPPPRPVRIPFPEKGDTVFGPISGVEAYGGFSVPSPHQFRRLDSGGAVDMDELKEGGGGVGEFAFDLPLRIPVEAVPVPVGH